MVINRRKPAFCQVIDKLLTGWEEKTARMFHAPAPRSEHHRVWKRGGKNKEAGAWGKGLPAHFADSRIFIIFAEK